MRKVVLAIMVLALAAGVGLPATAQTFNVIHVFNGSPDGEFPQAPLVQDADGNLYGTTTSGGGDDGTIFKVDAAGRESVLFNFNSLDGGFPQSGLILDQAGNLYGVANEGPGGAGVLFRLDKNGNEEILHAFQGGLNTAAGVPAGGVILDQAGNLYGATLAGGIGPFPGFGTLYQVDQAGTFKVLHEFHGTVEGALPQGPLVRDVDGNLYGAALQGGHNNNGTIFKVDARGTLTVLHTFTGGADGSAPQAGLRMDSAGNLIGSAIKGGDHGFGTVFAITKAGKFVRLYSFKGGSDGASPNGGLVQDADGSIYGTTQSGPGNFVLGTVFKLSRAHGLTVLHTFTGDVDGAVPLAGLIRDSAGNLYGTTVKNFLIRPVQGGGVFKIKP